MKPKYNRVLLKISGEALAGEQHFGINEAMTQKVAKEVKQIHDLGVQVAIVVGGGNFWRGRTSKDMDRATADYMGMLATVMNSLALQDCFSGFRGAYQSSDFHRNERDRRTVCEAQGAEPSWNMEISSSLEPERANPFFSTDTTAALRAARDGRGDNIAG